MLGRIHSAETPVYRRTVRQQGLRPHGTRRQCRPRCPDKRRRQADCRIHLEGLSTLQSLLDIIYVLNTNICLRIRSRRH
jgi:hypothetical protein